MHTIDIVLDDYRKTIFEYVEENFSPEEVFDDKELEAWALDNGFVKENKWKLRLKYKMRY